MKKTKLQKIIAKLKTGLEPLESFDQLESDITLLTRKLHRKVEAQSLDSVNETLNRFRNEIDLKPILDSLEELKSGSEGVYQELGDNLKSRADELFSEAQNALLRLKEYQSGLDGQGKEITSLKTDLGASNSLIKALDSNHGSLKTDLLNLDKKLVNFVKDLTDKVELVGQGTGKAETGLLEMQATLKKFRQEFLQMLANIGGGNANRNIAIGGNTSVLSTFTDINIKAGSNVTLSYSNNQTTKYLDLTIAATGGAGTVRNIKTITVSSVIGTLAGTDQVILANGGIQITLPTAVSDTNLYTIKNVGTSSVLVSTTGGQTIDGSPNIIMPIQYTSVDLVSDNSNWEIT